LMSDSDGFTATKYPGCPALTLLKRNQRIVNNVFVIL
jgi:hypothetical protein